ncbi:MAG: ATP-binding protein [Actinomycetota bacterium]
MFALVLATGLVGLASFLGLLAFGLHDGRLRSFAQAEIQADNISRLMAEHAEATIRNVDLVLRDAREHIDPAELAAPSDERRHAVGHLLAVRQSHSPGITAIRVFNREGRLAFGPEEAIPVVSIADRPHFVALRRTSVDELVVSEPLMSRVDHRWAVVLARRLTDRQGNFAGTINAVLDLTSFNDFYRSIDLGAHGALVLRNHDMTLLARSPPSPAQLGRRIASHHGLAHIEQGLDHAVYTARGQVDGEARIYSMRRVGALPLYVFAGVAERDLLAEWWPRLWVSVAAAGTASGVVAGLFVVVRRGLGAHQAAQVALAESEERLRTLADYTYDWEYWQGPDHELLYVTPSCQRVTGYSQAEFLEDPNLVYDIIFPSDRPLMDRHLEDSATEDQSAIDFRIITKSGDMRWIAHACRAVYWRDGRFMGRRASNRDITERKQLEKELRALTAELESRVEAELAKSREKDHILIQQSRLAAMGEMVHNIAHQWRQPLNGLSIIVANIKDDFDYGELTAERLDQAVERVHHLLETMSTTIDDFRNFFRPDRESATFDVAEAVEHSLLVMDASLKNNAIAVYKALTPGLAAFGHANQFAQAVLNIVANAKEAIQAHPPAGGGRISLRLEQDGGDGVLTVHDNGGGVPADVLPRIFDPYFTTKEAGSGIGLYMTRTIIEHNLGGTITAENVGEGALVTIRVPLHGEDSP